VSRPLLLSAGLLGVVAGLRSQIPNAALAARGLEPTHGPLKLLGTGPGRRASYLAAVLELVADKLPTTPSRVQPVQLVGRVVSGAVAAAALASATGVRGPRLVPPVLAGSAGAWAGSWGGYLARRAAVERTGLPDPVIAVAEDLLAGGLALAAVQGRCQGERHVPRH
jgi:uncharacterized membrane protein